MNLRWGMIIKLASLSILNWYNWRALDNIPYVDGLYVLAFSFVAWALIQGIDFMYRKIRNKGRSK